MLSILLVFVIPVLGIVWVGAELKDGSSVKRIILGTVLGVSIGLCSWGISELFTSLEYKVWDGAALEKLIGTVIIEIENGNEDVLVKELKEIQLSHGSRYVEQVDAFAEKVKKAVEEKNMTVPQVLPREEEHLRSER